MRLLDLCAGIGGMSLGFEIAHRDFRTAAFVEIEPYCQQVLARHWPDTPIFGDVKEFTGDEIGDIDIITAGYPCQPFSLAGRRQGEKDDRHLWPDICRIVARKRPAWCLFENVYGHVSMGLDEVLADLESEGYATRPFVVPACAVDAPHRRNRVFVVAADTERNRLRDEPRRRSRTCGKNAAEPVNDGAPRPVADAGNERLPTPERETVQRTRRRDEGGAITKCSRWSAEPRILRVAHGIPKRVHRLKALGNSVVPQVVARFASAIHREHVEMMIG